MISVITDISKLQIPRCCASFSADQQYKLKRNESKMQNDNMNIPVCEWQRSQKPYKRKTRNKRIATLHRRLKSTKRAQKMAVYVSDALSIIRISYYQGVEILSQIGPQYICNTATAAAAWCRCRLQLFSRQVVVDMRRCTLVVVCRSHQHHVWFNYSRANCLF